MPLRLQDAVSASQGPAGRPVATSWTRIRANGCSGVSAISTKCLPSWLSTEAVRGHQLLETGDRHQSPVGFSGRAQTIIVPSCVTTAMRRPSGDMSAFLASTGSHKDCISSPSGTDHSLTAPASPTVSRLVPSRLKAAFTIMFG